MAISKIRLQNITGSYGDHPLAIDDQLVASATGSHTSVSGVDVMSHLASAIKRIHGAESFTEMGEGKVAGVDSTVGMPADGFRVALNAFVVADDSNLSAPNFKVEDAGTVIRREITLGASGIAPRIKTGGSSEVLHLTGSGGMELAGLTGGILVDAKGGDLDLKSSAAATLLAGNGDIQLDASAGSSAKILLKDKYTTDDAIVSGGGIHLSSNASDVSSFKTNFPGVESIIGALNSAAGNLGEVNSYVRPRPGFGQNLGLVAMKGGIEGAFTSNPSDGDALSFSAYDSSSGVVSITITAKSSSPADDQFLIGADEFETRDNLLAMTLSTATAAVLELVEPSSTNSFVMRFKNPANGASLASISGGSAYNVYQYAYGFSGDASGGANYVAEPSGVLDLSGLDASELDTKVDIYLNGQLMVHTQDPFPGGEQDLSVQRYVNGSSQNTTRFVFGYELSDDDVIQVKVR